MNDTPSDHRHTVALFRYGLIADLAQLPAGTKGLYALIQAKADHDYAIPGSTRTRVAPETLRDWLKRYRRGGFDALLPKTRTDRGRPRSLPPQVADILLGVKEGNSRLSVQLVIREARDHPEIPPELPLPASTVHRLLARHGLMDKQRGDPSEADRRRFAFKQAGEMWMSDVMHGPTVFVGGRKRKTYLIAFIDDATRVIPDCAFTLSENTTTFLPVFKQAVRRRGLPHRLYVDNGANYRSRHLAIVCAKLGCPDSRPALSPARERENRALVQNRTGSAPDPSDTCRYRQPRGAEPAPANLGSRGVPPRTSPRPGRTHTAGTMGAVWRGRAFPRTRPGP